jgi:hypothetical protein
LIPLVFRNLILISKFIFLGFQFFFVRGEKDKLAGSWLKKKKSLFIPISTTKIVEVDVNELYLVSRVL